MFIWESIVIQTKIAINEQYAFLACVQCKLAIGAQAAVAPFLGEIKVACKPSFSDKVRGCESRNAPYVEPFLQIKML